MKILFIAIGILSISINWIIAQYAGIGTLRDFGVEDEQVAAIYNFFQIGPSSDFLNTLAGVMGWNSLFLNLIGLTVLILMLFIIWRLYLKNLGTSIKIIKKSCWNNCRKVYNKF